MRSDTGSRLQFHPRSGPFRFFRVFRMSSIPLPPDSSARAVDWRALRASVERGMLRERASLRGRMRRLEDASRSGKDLSAEIGKLLADAQQSESQVRQRQARMPKVTHPEELPISTKRGEIADTIHAHQVVIVCGETRFGKNHAVAENLPGPRVRRARHDRPCPAAPDCGAAYAAR